MSTDNSGIPESILTMGTIVAVIVGACVIIKQYSAQIGAFFFGLFKIVLFIGGVILFIYTLYYLWCKWCEWRADIHNLSYTSRTLKTEFQGHKEDANHRLSDNERAITRLSNRIHELEVHIQNLKNWTGLAAKEKADRLAKSVATGSDA